MESVYSKIAEVLRNLPDRDHIPDIEHLEFELVSIVDAAVANALCNSAVVSQFTKVLPILAAVAELPISKYKASFLQTSLPQKALVKAVSSMELDTIRFAYTRLLHRETHLQKLQLEASKSKAFFDEDAANLLQDIEQHLRKNQAQSNELSSRWHELTGGILLPLEY